MPRYIGRPISVEAVEYLGLIGDLPEAFARVLEAAEDGAAILTTSYGTRLVQPGEWLVRGVEGVLPMPPGVFEASFEKVAGPVMETGIEVTFTGSEERVVWMGHEFPRGKAVVVADRGVLEKLRANRHFSVAEPVEKRPTLTLKKTC